MRDGEVTLAYPGVSLTVGRTDTEAVLLGPPDFGDVAIDAADAPRARTDGVSFGTDLFGGRTVTFDLGIARRTEAEALDSLERLRLAWRADSIRKTPGATATLTFRRAGRERMVIGRPRRFAENVEHVEEGLVQILADFAAGDDVFYGTTEHVVSVSIAPSTGGGLIAPLAAPLATTQDSDRSTGMTVGGSLSAWPIIEIDGPITNPVVEVLGVFRMEFRRTVAEGDTFVVDTAPWARTVLLNGSPTTSGLTRASTRLSRAAMPPGDYEVALSGNSPTGTASARVRWREAYPTL